MPDATTATQPTAAAPPPLPSTSIDDLLSPEKYQKIVGQEQKLIERKIGAEGAVTAEYERREKAERERMERLTKAEGVSPDDLKPWDPNTMAPPPTSLWDKFGSPGFVISMLASAFTAMPMNSALQAGGAAMDAINRGDQEGYKRAFDTWKTNTDLVIKRQEMEHRAFEDIAKLRETDMTEWRAKMEGILRQFGDERKLILLQNGWEDELIQSESALAKATSQMQEAQNFIQENHLRQQIVGQILGWKYDDKGNLQPGAVRDPQQIAAATARAEAIIKGSEPAALAITGIISQPDFFKKSTDEQNKQIAEGFAKIEAAKYPFRGMPSNIVSREAVEQISAWDATHPTATPEEKAAAHEEIISKVSMAGKMPTKLTDDQLAQMGWTQRAINAAAETYNETGKLPSYLGRGPTAGIISGTIQDRAAELLKDKGKTVEDRTRDWQRYSTEKVAQNRFLSGPQGNIVRSLNTVVYHLETMKELADALHNGDVPRFNAIAQRWAEETGKQAPTNFDTAKQIVGAEVIKALGVAGAGTKEEREEAADAFKRSRSPDQIYGSIKTMQSLLIGQLRGLRRQFVASTGLPESKFDSMLEPTTRGFFEETTQPAADGWKIERVQ